MAIYGFPGMINSGYFNRRGGGNNGYFLTGFGRTNTPGGYSNANFGAPQIYGGFGFPPPGVDPRFFFNHAASSFDTNRLLGAAAGIAVPVNFGPKLASAGIPPFLQGYRFF